MLTEEQPTIPDYPPEETPPRRWPKRLAVGAAVLVPLLLIGGFVAVAFGLSGSSIRRSDSGLATVEIDSLGGEVERVVATDAKGKEVPVEVKGDEIVPSGKLHPGETVKLEVTVKRPSTTGWLVGGTTTKTITMKTPRANLTGRWIAVSNKSGVPQVEFKEPVMNVTYGQAGELKHKHLKQPQKRVGLGEQAAAGSMIVAASPAAWEKVGKFKTITWYPAGGPPTVAATPAPGSEISPSTPFELVTSKKVSKVFAKGEYPTLDPEVPGKWTKVSPHAIRFTPEGFGAPMDVELEAKLPEPLEVVQGDGSVVTEEAVTWTVPGGSELRLQQMLADLGYMPNEFKAAGGQEVGLTPEEQVRAATEPPEGEFNWRWKNTPSQLKDEWEAGEAGPITEGALMSFQERTGLETDAVAGPEVWEALMKAEIAKEVKPEKGAANGYTYVTVNESLPEEVHVWHNGKIVFNGPGNTGIPGAETELGTHDVYLRYEETTMSGENPDGSHYEDPGIMWVSYFYGGDALHAFDRASYGSPQSLGCVEMPLEDAAAVWPYTPLGTPVHVEGA